MIEMMDAACWESACAPDATSEDETGWVLTGREKAAEAIAAHADTLPEGSSAQLCELVRALVATQLGALTALVDLNARVERIEDTLNELRRESRG